MKKSRLLAGTLVALLVLGTLARPPQIVSQTTDEEKSIRSAIEGYLNAREWKERLSFVEDPANQEAAMRQKYAGAKFQLEKPAVRKIDKMENLPDTYLVKAGWTEKGKSAAFAGFYVVRKSKMGMKIDWPASVGYNAMSLKSLVAKKPPGTHRLRLIAAINSTYTGDYAKGRNTHHCFLLKEDNPRQTVYGYIPKDSPDGERLRNLLKGRQETRDRVIVEIQFVGPSGQNATNARTVAISKLVSATWVQPR